jgi:PD-(D/E)XK endonuclease
MHTSQKGDIGLCRAITYFVESGYYVSLPISEHLPYDLIADDGNGILKRIQVKYAKVRKTGIVAVSLQTSSHGPNGYRITKYDPNSVDGFVAFCPDLAELYFLRSEEVFGMSMATLRVEPPKNNQKSGIRLAKDFRDVSRLWYSTR